MTLFIEVWGALSRRVRPSAHFSFVGKSAVHVQYDSKKVDDEEFCEGSCSVTDINNPWLAAWMSPLKYHLMHLSNLGDYVDNRHGIPRQHHKLSKPEVTCHVFVALRNFIFVLICKRFVILI